jgi:hypothetical protein
VSALHRLPLMRHVGLSPNRLHQHHSRSQSLGSAVSALGSVLQSTAQVFFRLYFLSTYFL